MIMAKGEDIVLVTLRNTSPYNLVWAVFEQVLVCNWPHFVEQNHFCVKMFFNRDSAIQKCFQKILHSFAS
jgi:hypothetical protein